MGSTILCLRAFRAHKTRPADEIGTEPYPLLNLPAADVAEIKRLLEAPKAASAPIRRHSYYRKPNIASYITATRDCVFCLMVLGDVTREQAEEIDRKLDITARMVLPAFQDVVEVVLGESINPEHPKGSYIAKWHRLV
jgi:hypothetical protein